MQLKKKPSGVDDEPVPSVSTADEHVISKPWGKETRVASDWMAEQLEHDYPLFVVSTHSIPGPQR
jgi:hypothetical protein